MNQTINRDFVPTQCWYLLFQAVTLFPLRTYQTLKKEALHFLELSGFFNTRCAM